MPDKVKRRFFWVISIALGLNFSISSAISSENIALRFLVPHDFTLQSEKELSTIVEEYNRLHPTAKVELIRKGADFSALKDLMAFYLAGTLPDIAAIECFELPALESINLIQPLPNSKVKPLVKGIPSWALHQTRNSNKQWIALPFQRVAPVLILDQERLFRIGANPHKIPQTWNGIIDLAHKISPTSENFAITLPIQGPRGLWLFEAITEKPLWVKETNRLKINQSLKEEIQTLRSLAQTPKLLKTDDTLEKATQAFLDRKIPGLIASTDIIPQIANQATFRWTAVSLPKIKGGISELKTGSNLIIIHQSPELWRFLKYLYSPNIENRWTRAGGFIPLRDHKQRSRAIRTSDFAMVKARSEWIQALKVIFGDNTKSISIDEVMTHLDNQLAKH